MDDRWFRLGDHGRYPTHAMKATERIKMIDGIEYELAVRDERTGYFGSWFCRRCNAGCVDYDLLPEICDALAESERRAIEHHEAQHRNTDGQ